MKEMKDWIKKGMYLGLGLAGTTKERIEKIAEDVAAQTKMTEQQGREFAKYLEEESHKAREELNERVDEIVKRAMKHTPGLRRVERLEERVAELENAAGDASKAAKAKADDKDKKSTDTEKE